MSTPVYTLAAHHLVYALSPEHPPALTVPAGATVRIDTCDCFENQIQSENQDFGTLDWNRINPATGPIFIEGAEPGDILAVRIDDIQLARRGVMTTGRISASWGAICAKTPSAWCPSRAMTPCCRAACARLCAR